MIEALLALLGFTAVLVFAIILLFAPAILELIKPRDIGPRPIPELFVQTGSMLSASVPITINSCTSEFSLQPFDGWDSFSNVNASWYGTYDVLLE